MKRSPRLISMMVLIMTIALLLSGCMSDTSSLPPATPQPPMTAKEFTDKTAAYEMYDAIKFDMTRTQLTQLWGEPKEVKTENNISYIWTKGESGVAVSFHSDAFAFGKVINYEDVRQFASFFEGIKIENASKVSEKMPYDMVVSIMGMEGLEIARVENRDKSPKTTNRLLLWVDKEGNCAQISLDNDNNVEYVKYQMFNAAPATTDAPAN